MKVRLESAHAETGCKLVIDDDGRVASAYLVDPEGLIMGDVWLYNRVEPGPEIDFEAGAPFANPYASPPDQPLPKSANDLAVHWSMDETSLFADVMLRGVLLARLSPGSQPGWHVWAHEGPLANPFPK